MNKDDITVVTIFQGFTTVIETYDGGRWNYNMDSNELMDQFRLAMKLAETSFELARYVAQFGMDGDSWEDERLVSSEQQAEVRRAVPEQFRELARSFERLQ